MNNVYDLPADSSERTLVLSNPSIKSVLNGIRKEFEKIVDGRTTRVVVIFSSRETENPEVAEIMRGLIMRLNFSFLASTRRYTSLQRRFESPHMKIQFTDAVSTSDDTIMQPQPGHAH
jgi:hypothetical protein